MTKVQCTFYSECLGRDVTLQVLLPKHVPEQTRIPVLYLLHGLSDCSTTWLNRTSLERYADNYNMVIVLPDGARSFYCDMAYGDAYYTHISKEVIELCERLFPVATDAAHRFIAGNSMGGYGALKIALKNSGKFSKVGIFSGVMDVQDMVNRFPEYQHDWYLCFGGNTVPDSEDVLSLLKQRKRENAVPELYHCCGTEDFLAEENRIFDRLCTDLHVPQKTVWENGASHEWSFWDAQLPKLLEWLAI